MVHDPKYLIPWEVWAYSILWPCRISSNNSRTILGLPGESLGLWVLRLGISQCGSNSLKLGFTLLVCFRCRALGFGLKGLALGSKDLMSSCRRLWGSSLRQTRIYSENGSLNKFRRHQPQLHEGDPRPS